MNFFKKKELWEKANAEQLKAEIIRLQSQKKELEIGVTTLAGSKTGLEMRLNTLNKEIANKTQRLEIVTDIMSTTVLLKEKGIEIIYTGGQIICDRQYGGNGEETLNKNIIFGNGSEFAKYVKAYDGKIVLQGSIAYLSLERYSGGGWRHEDKFTDIGLAFVEIPHINAYFIPTSNKKSEEE